MHRCECKWDTCEAKICTFTLECTHFIFNKGPTYTHVSSSAKFSTSWDEMDYRVYSTYCMLSHNRGGYLNAISQKKLSFIYWTLRDNHRASAQPQVKLGFLCNNSLGKFVSTSVVPVCAVLRDWPKRN